MVRRELTAGGPVVAVLFVAVLFVTALGACGVLPGDKGLPIAFVNRTGETIILYEKGRANPSYRKELAPDERSQNVWVDSRLDERMKNERIYKVEATTPSGDVVFCHVYSFNELVRVNWTVELRKQNDCPT